MDKVRLAGCGEAREWTDCWAFFAWLLLLWLAFGSGVLLRCEWCLGLGRSRDETREEKRMKG